MPRPSTSPADRLAAEPLSDAADPALHLWVVFARAYRAIEAHATADAARHGLTLAEFGILEALYHKGRLLLGALGNTILVSSGGTTFLVDRLERRGLVKREACPEDRRARYATLTPAGTALIAELFPLHAARIHEVVGGLTAAQQREATALLRTLGLHAASIPLPEPAADAGGKGGRGRRGKRAR